MYIVSFDRNTVNFQVTCGTGIPYYCTWEAKINRSPRRGINAHVRHHANNNKFSNLIGFQIIQKFGFSKTIWKVFLDHFLSLQWSDVWMDISSNRTRYKKWHFRRIGRNMLNMDNRCFSFSKMVDYFSGIYACGNWVYKFYSAIFKIFILNVYDN
ncbi:hypothetical protein D3C81_1136910 [compost metagenome]